MSNRKKYIDDWLNSDNDWNQEESNSNNTVDTSKSDYIKSWLDSSDDWNLQDNSNKQNNNTLQDSINNRNNENTFITNTIVPVATNNQQTNNSSIWDDIIGIGKNIGRSAASTVTSLGSYLNRLNDKFSNRKSDIEDYNKKSIEESLIAPTQEYSNTDSFKRKSEVFSDFISSGDEEDISKQKGLDYINNDLDNSIETEADKMSNPVSKFIGGTLAPVITKSVTADILSGGIAPLSTTIFGASAADNYYREGKNRDMNNDQSLLYSSVMGTVEGLTNEFTIGNAKKVGSLITGTTNKISSEASSSTLKETLKTLGINIAENAFQEAITDPIQEATAQIVAGKGKTEGLGQEMAKDAISGGLVAAIMGGASIGISSCQNIIDKSNNKKSITKDELEIAVKDAKNNGINVEKNIQDNVKQQISKYNGSKTTENDNIDNLIQPIGNLSLDNQIQIKDENNSIAPIENINYSKQFEKNSQTQLAPIRELTYDEQLKKYKFDPNNETIKQIRDATDARGIKLSYNEDNFKDNNVNAIWKTSIDENGNNSREIIINPKANPDKTLQNITIHELTHDIEGTEEYESLRKIVEDYDSGKNGYAEARKSLAETYSKVYDSKSEEFKGIVDKEAVADILGSKLGDQEFVNNLVTKNNSIGHKIYSWVVDKLNKINKLTGYKSEKIYWADVKNKFEKAFNTSYKNSDNGIKYSIAGIEAVKNINNDTKMHNQAIDSYNQANKMAEQKIDNEKIRKDTGWFQDKNGNWKFEFSDKNMSLRDDLKIENGKTYKLGDILKHDTLFMFYPELKEYNIKFEDINKGNNTNINGSYVNKYKTITLDINKVNDKIRSQGTLIHEIQHAIQHIEGFEHGTSKRNGAKKYYNNLGEIEANDTKQRYLQEREGIINRIDTAPESSKDNPIHSGNNSKNIIDKIKESVYNYFNNKGENDYEEDYKFNKEDRRKNINLVDDGINLSKEKSKNEIREKKEDSSKSSFSLAENNTQDNLKLNRKIEKYHSTMTDFDNKLSELQSSINEKNDLLNKELRKRKNKNESQISNLKNELNEMEFNQYNQIINERNNSLAFLHKNITESYDNSTSSGNVIEAYNTFVKKENKPEIFKEIASWKTVNKSPYSDSYYNANNIGWNSKPEGSLRISDHWNFESQGKVHCKLEGTNNEPINKWIMAKYEDGKYKVIKNFESSSDKSKVQYSTTNNNEWQNRLDTLYKNNGKGETLKDVKNIAPVVSNDRSNIKEVAPIGDNVSKNVTRHDVIQYYKDIAKDNISNIANWKDKNAGWKYSTETMERNMYDIIPNKEEAKKIINEYFNPIHENEANKQRFINNYNEKIKNLKLNNDEAIAVQVLGESKYNPEFKSADVQEIVDKVTKDINDGKVNKQKVEKAVELFRNIYDETFDKVNSSLKENGYKEIPYRKGYFPHFTEYKPSNVKEEVLNSIGINPDMRSLPTDIAGITEQFVPGKTWNRSSLERKTNSTDYNALKGFDSYIGQAADNIFHTSDIQKLRGLENEIRYEYSDKGVQNKINEIENNETLDIEQKQDLIDKEFEKIKNPMPNLVTQLREYTNSLANKKSQSDRNSESFFGRPMYSVVNAIEKRFGANAVGLNIGSAVTNFIPITQASSEISNVNMSKAIANAIKSSVKDDGFSNKSTFLTNRVNQSEKLYKSTLDKVTDTANIAFKSIDDFTSNVIVRGKYYDNIKEGMSEQEAMKNADAFAANVMADRSKGAQPTLFNSKSPIVKAFTQFQLEVNNQYRFMFKDLPRDMMEKGSLKLASAFFKMFVGAWLYNWLDEKITGRKSAFSPIDIINDSFNTIKDKNETTYNKVADIAKNVASQLPFAGSFLGGGRIPISGALPDISNVAKSGIGLATGEMDSNKAIQNLGKEVLKPALYLLPPLGGGQLKKSYEGISTVNNGGSYSYDQNGNKILQFPIENKSIENYIKAGIFGKYALPEAKDYADRGYKSLNAKQTNSYEESSIPYKEYLEYLDQKLEKNSDKLDYLNKQNWNENQKWGIFKNEIISNSKRKDGTTQLNDANIFIKNGMSKTDYMDAYSTLSKNNLDMIDLDKYEELKNKNVNVDSYIKYEISSKSSKKDIDKMQILKNLNINNNDKSGIYESTIGSNDKLYQIMKKSNIDINNYLDYKQQNFDSDYTDNGTEKGKIVSGSKAQKVYNYINNSKLNYNQRLLLLGTQYKLNTSERNTLADYVDNLKISSSDKNSIYKKLKGFTIYNNGKISY